MPRQTKSRTSKNRTSKRSSSSTSNNVIGYCVKCKAKQTIAGAKKVQTKRKNRFAMKGTCPKCSTKMFRFV